MVSPPCLEKFSTVVGTKHLPIILSHLSIQEGTSNDGPIIPTRFVEESPLPYLLLVTPENLRNIGSTRSAHLAFRTDTVGICLNGPSRKFCMGGDLVNFEGLDGDATLSLNHGILRSTNYFGL